MTDDPIKRLRELGDESTPVPDPKFVDRLESHLRATHAQETTTARRRLPVLLPRLGIAALVVVAAVVGSFALSGRDAGVDVEVVEGGSPAPVAAAGGDGGDGANDGSDGATTPVDGEEGADGSTIDEAPTPTATPPPEGATVDPDRGGRATAVPESAVGSSDETATAEPTVVVSDPTAEPTTEIDPAAEPTRAVVSTPEPTPVLTVQPTRVGDRPTSIPQPVTAVPVPTSTPESTPTPAPTATPTPLPTPTPEPLVLDLSCAVRVVGDTVGVLCEWDAPTDIDLTSFRLIRSLDGGETETVSNQRAGAPRTYADRDVSAGDTAIYLVRALVGDRVVGASVREVVSIPS